MKKLPIVVTGSLAYDHVMTFHDKFANHILPDKVHMLNVSFNIETLEVDLGGTAGNIAYNLALLKEKPTIHATVGSDFENYKKKLKSLKLSTDSIKVFRDVKTAQAFITTDLADNQITAFYGGAMYRAHEHPLSDCHPKLGSGSIEKALVIVAPNGVEAMVENSKYCQLNQHPFIFDPGQAFNALSDEQLLMACKGSKAMVVNDYEWELWQKKVNLNEKKTLELTEAIIITLGENGSTIITKKGRHEYPSVPADNVIDPTGAGDAFRAGLLYCLSRGWEWDKAIQTGATLASFCVEVQGPQNHKFTTAEFKERYKKTWKETF